MKSRFVITACLVSILLALLTVIYEDEGFWVCGFFVFLMATFTQLFFQEGD